MDARAYQGFWRDRGYISAIANAAMALRLLGAVDDDPDFVRQMKAIEDLVLDGEKDLLPTMRISYLGYLFISIGIVRGGAPNDHPAVQSAGMAFR